MFSPSIITRSIAALALGAACVTAPAFAAPTAGASDTVAAADRQFVEKAAVGGMTEVELGNLAQSNAASDQVKQFGARMAQDHGKANDELKQVATTKGIDVPTSLDKKNQAIVDRMKKL